MIDPKYEVYRVVLDYEGLHEGLIDRVEDIGTTRLAIDEAAGFAPGYASKVLCNPPLKILGRDSLGRDGLGKMLKATGMALILVIDDEKFAPVKAQLSKRRRTVPPNGSISRPAWLISKGSSDYMQILRNNKLSPQQRKRIAKRAAKARWRRKAIAPAPCAKP